MLTMMLESLRIYRVWIARPCEASKSAFTGNKNQLMLKRSGVWSRQRRNPASLSITFQLEIEAFSLSVAVASIPHPVIANVCVHLDTKSEKKRVVLTSPDGREGTVYCYQGHYP